MKKVLLLLFVLCICSFTNVLVSQSFSNVGNDEYLLANVEALSPKGEYDSGTCKGCGPHFTDVSCPGGGKMCGMSHGDVYGEK